MHLKKTADYLEETIINVLGKEKKHYNQETRGRCYFFKKQRLKESSWKLKI